MFKLGKLEELYVERNYLSGLVSDELHTLSLLVHLDLSENANDGSCNTTGGEIPIDISSNGLEGDILGPNIGKLTKLQELKVHRNNFNHSIASEIGQLGELEYFHANSNKLSGTLPSEITKLSSLKEIWLGSNKNFTGTIPETIGNMKALGEEILCLCFHTSCFFQL
jgi:Leucine-rich repeat (LRR) protein